jgi:hypothetical protein
MLRLPGGVPAALAGNSDIIYFSSIANLQKRSKKCEAIGKIG